PVAYAGAVAAEGGTTGTLAGHTVERLVQLLSAPAPAPSGGAASAITGAMAAALVEMVARGSPAWPSAAAAAARAAELRARLLDLADEDVRAFASVLDTARRNRGAPAEQRHAAMRRALAAASEPPRAIAEAAGEVAQVAAAAAAAGKEPMRADAAVAATLARGAAAAALQVVEANAADAPAAGEAPAPS